jgi:CRP-like cAMP-binding protein
MSLELIFSNFAMHINLQPDEIAYVNSILNIKSVKKNTILLNAGAVCKSLFFVNSGLLRLYYQDSNGLEHNISFAPENWWMLDSASFFGQSPASYTISAIENSELYYLSYSSLEELFIKIPKFERFFRILTQNGFKIYQSRILANISKTAEERYFLFQKLYPNLELRITQKHIASYLGITPVFLSRLRHRK